MCRNKSECLEDFEKWTMIVLSNEKLLYNMILTVSEIYLLEK